MSVGLDIGSKTIKIVELGGSAGNYSLQSSGIVGYTGNSADKMTDAREIASLAAILKKLHREARISTNEVGIAIPEQLVFSRVIRFPLLTDQEVAAAVKWEAEQYIPIPKEEAIIQHQILEKREKSSPPEVLVLLVAVPKKVVENYVNVCEMAGLVVTFVETELMSLTRCLAPKEKTVMIVDFGARSTDLAISKNGNLSFSRSIPTAGEAFTRAVAQGLGIEAVQAEEYKKTYGLSTQQLEGKVKATLDPVFRIVVDEIKKGVHFYQTEEKGDSPTSVILVGGTSTMPEASTFLTKYLGIEVVIGNPFEGIKLEPEVARNIQPFAPLYPVAVGLAKRE